MAYSIALAKKIDGVEQVILSTDSPEYAKIGEKYGAQIPFLRPKELSLDTSTDYDFMSHAVAWFDKNAAGAPDYWIHLRPTTPLRDVSVVERAMSLIEERLDATALRSSHLSPESPFKWFRRSRDGYLMSLTTDDTDIEQFNGPRQSFPDVLIPNGYVDIVRSSVIREQKRLHGKRVLAFETPFCNELDAPEELELLEFQLQKNAYGLIEMLNELV
jgi:N-acylneuraminate cytidylyltransferase